MRCFISLVLGLLALEVALARNLQGPVFNSAQSMCSGSSSSEDTECNNCKTSEECVQNNDICCPGCCGSTYKPLAPIDVPKAGHCPWNPSQMITAGPCPKEIKCFSDSECTGNKKCCNIDCVMTCVNPEPEISLQ